MERRSLTRGAINDDGFVLDMPKIANHIQFLQEVDEGKPQGKDKKWAVFFATFETWFR